MSNQTQKAVLVPVAVNSEQELNSAIQQINSGIGATTIDVQTSFTLTKNVETITESLQLTSSNNSKINDGGFAFITIEDNSVEGIKVFLSMDAGGTGTSKNLTSGNGTTLIGLTGGVLANLSNSGSFFIPEGHVFKVGEVIGSANVCGTLDNSKPITCPQPYTGIMNVTSDGTTANGKMNDVILPPVSEGMVIVTEETNLSIKSIKLGELCSVNSSGNNCGTITTSDGIIAHGNNSIQTPGSVNGVNINGTLTLKDGGIYQYQSNETLTKEIGCKATEVLNESGLVELGSSGNWNFDTYIQTTGTLRFTIPNYKGGAAFLSLNTGTFNGGDIEINAGKYYDPKGFNGEKIKLMQASKEFKGDVTSLVKFNYFPEGISPSVEVKDNTLFLILSVNS
ncbi:hypothetical protein [Tenacibaculum agarivorans]|uniref:hypothetical protein n=1 Tax=Tenacibaculum agarivorans TaxID=1908389 RepID=UPI00094B8889|nr:hypothetical protein [Tenacibaculum agarivorans]